MSIVINETRTVVVMSDTKQAITVEAAPAITVIAEAKQGPSGPQGQQGVPGSIDDTDFPNFRLTFENGLI